MCRWFAYFSSTEPCLLEDVLVTPAHSLTKQVHDHYLPKLLSHDPTVHAEPTTESEITVRNRLFNIDGFGMAWYTSTLSTFSPSTQEPILYPAVYKSIQPPLHDSNFRSLCKNTSTNVLLAHIRAATSTAITSTNCHPFTFGIYTIMHNGYISDFAKIKRQLCAWMTQEAYENIQGGTDTEHLAALLISFLCPLNPTAPPSDTDEDSTPKEWEQRHTPDEIKTALGKTISTIIQTQQQILKTNAKPNDLNIAITNGHSLVACRYRNHETEQPPSLYYSTKAGVTLNRQFPGHPDGDKGVGEGKKAVGEHGKHLIIASEPTTYKAQDWILIEKNYVVAVGRQLGRDGVVVSVEKLKLGE